LNVEFENDATIFKTANDLKAAHRQMNKPWTAGEGETMIEIKIKIEFNAKAKAVIFDYSALPKNAHTNKVHDKEVEETTLLMNVFRLHLQKRLKEHKGAITEREL
jgi:hypothetical protein